MRLENTDRFRNRMCEVVFKNNTAIIGRIICFPNCSEKYNYHKPGWFVSEKGKIEDTEIHFKDISEIHVLY